jgi:uncharacterized membrane protein YqjE
MRNATLRPEEVSVLHSSNPEGMSSKELIQELASDAQLLVKRQVELAKLEARQQIRKELRTAELLSVGGALAYAGLILLLVSIAVAIGQAMNALWAGPLIVGAALLVLAVIAALIGWTKRVREPLPLTTGEVKKEIEWAKHHQVTS